MALVAYENSDSSDYEDEDSENATLVVLPHKTENKPSLNENVAAVVAPNKTESKSSLKLPEPVYKQNATKLDEEPQESGPNLFNLLPQPSKKKRAIIEEDDEFLHKKEDANAAKPKAKISVPSLSDFKDVETSIPVAKPRAPSEKKSGLLSMLPQPRNGVSTATTKSLIPHVLTKKPAPVKKVPLPTPLKNPALNPTPLITDYSDDSDNEEVQNDFFSIHKPVEIIPDEEMPLELEPKTSTTVAPTKPRSIESYFKKEEVNQVQLEPDYDDSSSVAGQSEAGSSYNEYGSQNSNSNEMVLDEEAIMKLCGSRGKRKREEIQIVDVNQQDVLGDAREMLLKGLMDDTTKRVSASKKKGNEPTSQQRRKHQITYLAYQAKVNEAELQNQWSNNRMSKRQTQAKYGF